MARLKTLLSLLGLIVSVLPSVANAQGTTMDESTANAEVRAPSPRIMNPDRPGYFQVGVGPAFASGLDSEGTLVNINTGYNRNFSDRFTGKAIADFNLGSGNDSARFISLGVGGEYYLNEVQMRYGVPYVGADLGFGFIRDSEEDTKDSGVVGVGTGFKFATETLNFDINLHYSVLTAEIEGEVPSVLALRTAVNF